MAESWTTVVVTLKVNAMQTLVFLVLFEIVRSLKVLVPIMHRRSVTMPDLTTPNAATDNPNHAGWAYRPLQTLVRVVATPDSHILDYNGFDAFVFIRLWRLGFLLTTITFVLGAVLLVPTYVTADPPAGSIVIAGSYNSLTMGHVASRDARLWVSVAYLYLTVGVLCWLLWREWKVYTPLRLSFLAQGREVGDAFSHSGAIDALAEKLLGDRHGLALPAHIFSPAMRYGIIVENIPLQYRSCPALKGFFEMLFPNQVASASLFYTHTGLNKAVQRREKALLTLESVLAKNAARAKRLTMRSPETSRLRLIGGKRVDAAEVLRQRLDKANAEAWGKFVETVEFLANLDGMDLKESSDVRVRVSDRIRQGAVGAAMKHLDKYHPLQDRAVLAVEPDQPQGAESQPPPTAPVVPYQRIVQWRKRASSTGVVMFKTVTAKQTALQMQVSETPGDFQVFAVPEPSDMMWQNVTTPRPAQLTARLLVNTLWCFGVLFWAVPVSTIQAVANLQSISQTLHITPPPPGSVWYGILSGYLPVLAMLALMNLLPVAINMSATRLIRVKSKSEADKFTFLWHFGFQVANLWLVIIGGSLFTQLDTLRHDVTKVIDVLAAAVPNNSQFFLNMMITQTFGGLFLELSQISGCVVYLLKGLVSKRKYHSKRKRSQDAEPQELKWGWLYPPIIQNLFVSLVYCTLVPVLQGFAAVYFGVGYLVWKHQCMHVYTQRNEGGGILWPNLFQMIMGCVYMSQVVFLGYMGLKQGIYQWPAVIVLMVLTGLFHLKVTARFDHHCRAVSLAVARRVDNELAGTASTTAEKPSWQSIQAQCAGSAEVKEIESQVARRIEQLSEEPLTHPSLRPQGWTQLES